MYMESLEAHKQYESANVDGQSGYSWRRKGTSTAPFTCHSLSFIVTQTLTDFQHNFIVHSCVNTNAKYVYLAFLYRP